MNELLDYCGYGLIGFDRTAGTNGTDENGTILCEKK